MLEDIIDTLNNELNLLKNINTKLNNKNKELLKENNILSESFKNNTSNVNNIIKEIKNKKKYTNKYKKQKIPATIRNLVWNTYFTTIDGICICCNHEKISRGNFQCGHIVSEKNGGTLHISNLKPICALCNASMGTMNMNDFININHLYSIEKI